jgi:fimbrial isopeptide formation D2 family protein
MGAGIANAAPSPILDGGPTQGTIKIHKIKGVESGTRADGTPLSDQARQALGEPLANVTFDLYKIDGIDVHSTAGMAIAEKAADITITPEIVASGKLTINGKDYTFAKTTSITTNATGDASATVDLGVYIVNENLTTYPGDASAITPAAPFLAIMPQTNPRNHADWLYDLDVYPKNTENAIDKIVKDGNVGTQNQDGYKVGENLTYTLASTILAGDTNGDGNITGADLGYYYVEDTLPEGTSYTSSTVQAGTTPLTEGADYIVSQNGNKIGWSVTEDGLNKLAANSGSKLTIDIVARVDANNVTGELKNQAWFIPSNAWLVNHGNKPGTPGNTPPETPNKPPKSPEVVSKYGDIILKKTATDGTVLAGAEFKVYRATGGTVCDAAAVSGDPVATSAPTDAQGFTKVAGLQLSNWYNGAEQTNLHSYCIVESKAPEGYNLLPSPIKFDLTVPGEVTDLAAAFADPQRDVNTTDDTGGSRTIVDTKKPLLPFTGGAGIGVIGSAATIMAGAAGFFALRSRRKQEETA